MSARIGEHELRDSFHIIPEKLANLEKEHFDYSKLKRAVRANHRQVIIDYCISDCRNLLKFVKAFLQEFGFRISIGQAAMYELRKHYKVAHIGANEDAFLRHYFFGGRVECLAGRGRFAAARGKPYRLYDVNSMYPRAMAGHAHPTGKMLPPRRGLPNSQTVFIDLTCRNFGALVGRDEYGSITADIEHGRFRTTIWELEAAEKLGLVSNVKINWCLDYAERSTFENFVNPLYDRRAAVKSSMREIPQGSTAWNELHKDDIFLKLILNNAYGKFAQNPRKFKENYFTDPRERPPIETEVTRGQPAPWGDMPAIRCETHWIWERPAPGQHFNNVGTAASITGAARAILLHAIHNAVEPIYCDTDSLICKELHNVELDNSKLGAWKLEQEFDEVIIAGKKLYACKVAGVPDGHKDRVKLRSKGTAGLSWSDMLALLDDGEIVMTNKGPTLSKAGTQYYMDRTIRATTPVKTVSNWELAL